MSIQDNFYFNYIDIPYDLNEVQTFYKNNPIPNGYFTIQDINVVLQALPSIKKWFEDNGCKPNKVAYISTSANVVQPPHKDNSDQILAVNFPVDNCNEVETVFYDDTNVRSVLLHTRATNVPYHHYLLGDRKPTTRYILSKPVILNVKKIHSVVNTTNKDRISLSFRFEQEPWHIVKE
jgi:hypothetical protein